MNKNELFWTEHLIEAACCNTGMSRRQLKTVTARMRSIGGLTIRASLTSLANSSNAEIVKKFTPYILEVADSEGGEDIDEGAVKLHDNTKDMIQNHPYEVVNEHSAFSVQAPIA